VLGALTFDPQATGRGDAVDFCLGDSGIGELSHTGGSNFVVWTYPVSSRTDPLINEIGAGHRASSPVNILWGTQKIQSGVAGVISIPLTGGLGAAWATYQFGGGVYKIEKGGSSFTDDVDCRGNCSLDDHLVQFIDGVSPGSPLDWILSF